MKRFADLLETLILTPSRNGKLRLMIDFFRSVPDPERGYALAALTRELDIPSVKPALLRQLVTTRIDEELFRLSYDYVGDLGETVALIWPDAADHPARSIPHGRNDMPSLTEVVTQLQAASRREGPALIEGWLDRLDPSGRYALTKLVTGGFRIGLSARLAKQALAGFGNVPVHEIEELWHGLDIPYESLFAWLEGFAEKPVSAALAPFRPVMLSHPLEEGDFAKLNPEDFVAEWKWDGIRVQASLDRGIKRLYSRTGDDISPAFPDLVDALAFEGTIDGELLIARPAGVGAEQSVTIGTFSDLQQRLNRKKLLPRHLEDHPAFLRVYDLLFHAGEDLRDLPFEARRSRLEMHAGDFDPTRFDLSPLIPFDSWEDLAALRAEPPLPIIEGVMIKRRQAPYLAGRPRGEWFKWKRDPFLIDAVLMYAQRGHGKRSGFYSDYTFGVWREEAGHRELVPVGKAYFGFTDEELKAIDKFVRNNTVERFGPVRSVRADATKGLVLEVAFEGLNRSTRHKSGLAMRFPRISRLRWDKPPAEADTLEALEVLLASDNGAD
ncbi:cisplatin damage response ATP-dependent DNA ligase [Pseudohoeflea coraliihabitans]|uniref:DNA ligase (ATP) n=1 Tax=Pseudohoeflea coraliihabitans TaxID=2860393 RepID=A0ABS6WNE8_9HYPH|nr:cisplatin damage response ATP-dependent DNA ligase [Pseudohoeflea sp. DP4N28-3]MBW3097453.1 cisplatin damage response ATP-dependent DNA ligase [Pseudohoeflea sp. DP4N28-3]